MTIKLVGIDLAKNDFQRCGLTQGGKVVYEKHFQRKGLLDAVAQRPIDVIGVEACTGAFFWQPEFEKLGHQVKVISPQYVKLLLKVRKTTVTTPRPLR